MSNTCKIGHIYTPVWSPTKWQMKSYFIHAYMQSKCLLFWYIIIIGAVVTFLHHSSIGHISRNISEIMAKFHTHYEHLKIWHFLPLHIGGNGDIFEHADESSLHSNNKNIGDNGEMFDENICTNVWWKKVVFLAFFKPD